MTNEKRTWGESIKSLFAKTSESIGKAIDTVGSVASDAVSRVTSRESNHSDVLIHTVKLSGNARDKTFKAWQKVCNELKKANRKLGKLEAEKGKLERREKSARVNNLVASVLVGTVTVADRLIEVEADITAMEKEIALLAQREQKLSDKLDELDIVRSAIGQQEYTPEYRMHDFDGILNET